MPLLDSGTWQCLEAGCGQQSTEGIHLYIELTVTLSRRPPKHLKPSVCFIHCSTNQGFNYLLSQPGGLPMLASSRSLPDSAHYTVWPPLTLGIYTLIIHFTPGKSLEARMEPLPPKSLFVVTTWSWNFLNLGHSPTMSERPVRLVGEDEWQLGSQQLMGLCF